MLYFIVNFYFKGSINFLFSLISIFLSVLLAIWLYCGFRISRRFYFSFSPCIIFSFAVQIDLLCLIELLAKRGIVNFFLLRKFLNGGFEKHPLTFGGIFLFFLIVGILACQPFSETKNFFKTLITSTSLSFGIGLLFLLLFLVFYYYLVFLFVICMIVIIFLPKT